MKIHFVDGPLDGVSKHVEQEPDNTYYAPAIMYSTTMMNMEDLSKEKSFMFDHKHVYHKFRENPVTKTVIFVYVGAQ